MRMPELFRSTAFRLAIAFALATAAATAAVFALVYLEISTSDVARLRVVLVDEAAKGVNESDDDLRRALELRLTRDLRRLDYVALFGGKFRTHPAQLDIATEIVDNAHPITAGLGDFTVHDELYLFADYDPARVHLLAQTHSFDDNGPVPIAWTREHGAGRIFYISIGHNPSTLHNDHWQQFFKNGVEWALKRR